MKRSLLTLLSLCAVVGSLWCRPLAAEEPYLQLIEAMRVRGFADTALEYIADLRQRPNLPAEIKDVLSYEEFQVHQAFAKQARTAAEKQAALDKALAALERFTNESPNHPLAASANSKQAGLFLDQAKTLIWESRSEGDIRDKREQQEEARKLIAKSREIYQLALQQHQKVYDSYIGKVPDEKNEPEEYKIWHDSEQGYLRAQFDLAMCSYQEARTYDEGSEQYATGLKQAAEEFELIHEKYRSQGVGLFSRLMQGKCFQERGDLRRALGLYKEVLEHKDELAVMKSLQARALYFKLIALNEPEKHDYKLVISLATEWLTENRQRSKTTEGLGIQWERARALEKLASEGDLPREERDEYLQQAYSEAREIAMYAGEFRDLATAMVQRLEPLVEGKGGDPTNFGAAHSLARYRILQHKDFGKKIQAAGGADKKAAQAEFDLHLKETERVIRLGLSLADEDESPREIAEMHYFLAHNLFYSAKYYDAAAVANFIIFTATEEQAITAQDAAQVGLAALEKIMLAKPVSDRAKEREMMRLAAEQLIERWPDSARADDARFILGEVYRKSEQPLNAVEYYDQVTKVFKRYAEALMRSGQMYWVGYLYELQKPEASRADKAKLDEWVQTAEQRIKDGMTEEEQDLSSESTPSDVYIVARITLVEILNSQGREAESIKLFNEEPHSIMANISVENEASRPARGPKSRPVAIQTYQLLLRTYMGLGDIDNAIQTMNQLESVAGSENPDALTQIYIQLGLKLKQEIDRLRAEGNRERLESVTNAFDRFLGALASRQSGLDFNSLLWIGESYANLGDGMAGDSAAADAYYQKSAKAYDQIISNAESNPDFINPALIPSINTRIGVLLKRQGKYEQALKKITDVLSGNPKQIEAQMEAALILKQWAKVDNQPEKFLQAVRGNKSEELKEQESPIYGFEQLAYLIQAVRDNPNTKVPDLKQRYETVLYEMGDALYHYGLSLKDEAQRQDMLARAKGTLRLFALNSDGSEPESTWNKFDELYVSVQQDMGETPQPLKRPQGANGAINNNRLEPEAALATRGRKLNSLGTVIDDNVPEPTGLPSFVYILGAVILGLGGAAGMYYLLKPKKGRSIRGRGDDAPVSIGLPGSEPAVAVSAAAARPKAKPKPAPQPAAEAPAAAVPEQPVKKKSVADLTPEEKAALKKKLMAQKRAAAQARKSEES